MTIYVRTHGGLGNQLFQLSLGLEAAKKNKTDLILDTSWFKNIPEQSTKRVEYISNLCPNIPMVDNHDLVMSKVKIGCDPYQKFGFKKYILKEKYGHFDARYLNYQHAYYDGYWHSYKYLVENLIVKQLKFLSVECNSFTEYQERILEKNSVMLHIRRGDFLFTTNKNLVLDKSYYDHAIRRVLEREKNIELFIFSDDIEWVKSNWHFHIPTHYVILKMKDDTSTHELELMSNCKHHIIANSTFSWWGAWLGTKPGQIVIGPKDWLQDNHVITKNLIPPTWLTI